MPKIRVMSHNYEVGEIVFHRRYNYRGVIIGFDHDFKGTDEWYKKNRSQPQRNQPWYHVLVHDAQHMTYVAQENLERDKNQEPVEHPLVHKFFITYYNGRYYNYSVN